MSKVVKAVGRAISSVVKGVEHGANYGVRHYEVSSHG